MFHGYNSEEDNYMRKIKSIVIEIGEDDKPINTRIVDSLGISADTESHNFTSQLESDGMLVITSVIRIKAMNVKIIDGAVVMEDISSSSSKGEKV